MCVSRIIYNISTFCVFIYVRITSLTFQIVLLMAARWREQRSDKQCSKVNTHTHSLSLATSKGMYEYVCVPTGRLSLTTNLISYHIRYLCFGVSLHTRLFNYTIRLFSILYAFSISCHFWIHSIKFTQAINMLFFVMNCFTLFNTREY